MKDPAVKPLTANVGPVASFTRLSPPALLKVAVEPLPVLIIVTDDASELNPMPTPAVKPFVAKDGPVASFTRLSSPPALESVTEEPAPVFVIITCVLLDVIEIPVPELKLFVERFGPIPSLTTEVAGPAFCKLTKLSNIPKLTNAIFINNIIKYMANIY